MLRELLKELNQAEQGCRRLTRQDWETRLDENDRKRILHIVLPHMWEYYRKQKDTRFAPNGPAWRIIESLCLVHSDGAISIDDTFPCGLQLHESRRHPLNEEIWGYIPDKWLRSKQVSVCNLLNECDSYAAIEQARLTPKHRVQIQELCRKILRIMNQYRKK